jgi:hypothetical protein
MRDTKKANRRLEPNFERITDHNNDLPFGPHKPVSVRIYNKKQRIEMWLPSKCEGAIGLLFLMLRLQFVHNPDRFKLPDGTYYRPDFEVFGYDGSLLIEGKPFYMYQAEPWVFHYGQNRKEMINKVRWLTRIGHNATVFFFDGPGDFAFRDGDQYNFLSAALKRLIVKHFNDEEFRHNYLVNVDNMTFGREVIL